LAGFAVQRCHKVIDHVLNRNRLRYISAATDQFNGFVLITMSIDANSTNNVCLAMDFRGAPDTIRWRQTFSLCVTEAK